jgi:hypothetical protein
MKEPTKYGIVFNNEFQNIIEKIKKFYNDKKITNQNYFLSFNEVDLM